ncbi:vWA domain-containing protein [Nannocystaceae bacterium ST9]
MASRPLLMVSTLALPLLANACAVPCLDDGIGQKFCPPTTDEADQDGTDDLTTGVTEDSVGDTESCSLFDVVLIPQTPTVVLLVDQSGSMTAAFGDSDRWTTVYDVLVGPMGVVPQYQAGIRFGISLYTSIDGNTTGNECPILTEVPPDVDNLAPIQTLLDANGPSGETPTGESLDVVAGDLAAAPFTGQKFIVLATDGEPDTCAVPNPQEGQPEAVAAATNAFDLGIQTFIISVGDEVSEGHLQDMANAGRGVQMGEPDVPFYLALDPAALQAAFEDILAGVRSCKLSLEDPLSDEQAANCSVIVNGDEVPYAGADGWVLDNGDVELQGAACDALQAQTSSVSMECPCAAP